MARRLSEKQKEEIIKYFTLGKSLDELSAQFGFTKLTISKYLKKNIEEKNYKDLIKKDKLSTRTIQKKEEGRNNLNNTELLKQDEGEKFDYEIKKNQKSEEFSTLDQFMEITPLPDEIDNIPQKDLSSVPISEVDFPKIIYMIVDKKIELEIKYLKDYPEWQFLSKEELNRKTIQIYDDLKIAKRFCNIEQKVIKVPNTNVFKIVAPFLISKGISRIVTSDKLISL